MRKWVLPVYTLLLVSVLVGCGKEPICFLGMGDCDQIDRDYKPTEDQSMLVLYVSPTSIRGGEYAQFTARGGKAPYRYRLFPVEQEGVINENSGKYTAQTNPSTGSIKVQVIDSENGTAMQSVLIVLNR